LVKVTLSPSTIALERNWQSVFQVTSLRGFFGKTLMTQISTDMRKIPMQRLRIIDQIVPKISNPRISRTSPPIPDS
jgi:hypothetical protein